MCPAQRRGNSRGRQEGSPGWQCGRWGRGLLWPRRRRAADLAPVGLDVRLDGAAGRAVVIQTGNTACAWGRARLQGLTKRPEARGRIDLVAARGRRAAAVASRLPKFSCWGHAVDLEGGDVEHPVLEHLRELLAEVLPEREAGKPSGGCGVCEFAWSPEPPQVRAPRRLVAHLSLVSFWLSSTAAW